MPRDPAHQFLLKNLNWKNGRKVEHSSKKKTILNIHNWMEILNYNTGGCNTANGMCVKLSRCSFRKKEICSNVRPKKEMKYRRVFKFGLLSCCNINTHTHTHIPDVRCHKFSLYTIHNQVAFSKGFQVCCYCCCLAQPKHILLIKTYFYNINCCHTSLKNKRHWYSYIGVIITFFIAFSKYFCPNNLHPLIMEILNGK